MQSLAWYRNRLAAMTPREAWWRVGTKLQNGLDRCAMMLRRRTPPLARIAATNGDDRYERAAIFGPTFGRWTAGDDAIALWRSAAAPVAERILQNRLTLFDLEELSLGGEVNWNYEYKAQRRTPMRFSAGIDYRDYARTGDCKFVWEPNRHQHLVVLGRAYRLTGDGRFAAKVVEQMTSWMRQCPFGVGMNWRSPLELAIRLINWVWAIELIRPAGVIAGQTLHAVVACAYQHLREITRKYSRFSSANNHLIGEAAGVYIAASYFASLKRAEAWRRQAREILLHEIAAQTHPDGGNREQAMAYHLFVLEFFLLAALAGRHARDEFPGEYWGHVERMLEYVAAFAEGGPIPMFGDADDGYVLDLGARSDPAGALLAVGGALFGRDDWRRRAGATVEPVFWLLGEGAARREMERRLPAWNVALASRAFPASGRYLLQHGRAGAPDAVSVTFDCGELGLGAIAAHGHADALSVTLRVGGRDVLVDPGTYDYFTYPVWRDYFRGTRAHNTVVVDGVDQSEMLGSFLWGRRATAHCVTWQPSEDGGVVIGEHDGYGRLADPVVHRRSVTLNGRTREVIIDDALTGSGWHVATFYLHWAEQCRVAKAEPGLYVVDYGAGRAEVVVDSRLEVRLVRGREGPILGWVSRGYHRKASSATLEGRIGWEGELGVRTVVRLR